MIETKDVERVQTVVIGGGQAGLSVGYHLRRLGRPFVILEASQRVGDVWRNRWDSLRIFTPARFSSLDGMPFPARDGNHFPTKEEMADYLEAYAARFALPVRTGTRVERVSERGGRFLVEAGARRYEADQVVIAMADYQKPHVPSYARDLRPDIVQIHSLDYRNPSQLRDGDVLVVGAGNSGADIALDLADRHRVWLSGRDVGEIPFRIGGLPGRLILVRLVLRVLFHRILTVATPIGRKARPRFLSRGGPLVRHKARDLAAAGIARAPRTVGVKDGQPLLEDGRTLEVTNVVWCTGFRTGFSDWLDLPVLDGEMPLQDDGFVPRQPGLYFVGLDFLHSVSSSMIHGVGRDARRIANAITARTRGSAAPERAPAHHTA